MPTGAILRVFYFLLTLPVYFLAKILFYYNFFNIKINLHEIISVIDKRCEEIPNFYTSYLVAAEDHRSAFHFGIDQIAMLRAVLKNISSNERQGASTIEQQLVRVVTNNYSHSMRRKLKEQVLAVLLSSAKSKNDIAKTYMAIAYYGYDCRGISGIFNFFGNDLKIASENQVLLIVARLKYPKPSVNIARWEEKISLRVAYIKRRHRVVANKLR